MDSVQSNCYQLSVHVRFVLLDALARPPRPEGFGELPRGNLQRFRLSQRLRSLLLPLAPLIASQTALQTCPQSPPRMDRQHRHNRAVRPPGGTFGDQLGQRFRRNRPQRLSHSNCMGLDHNSPNLNTWRPLGLSHAVHPLGRVPRLPSFEVTKAFAIIAHLI